MEAMARTVGTGWGLAARVGFVGLALVSLVLGYVGLREHVGMQPQYGTGVLDIVYWDLQLFVLGSSPVGEGGRLPVTLQIARFGAPAATAYALFSAVYAVFGRQVVLLRARYARRHTVICGVSPVTTLLTRRLVAEGCQVVVIDADPLIDAAALGPPAGVLRIVGDPRDREVLRQAGVSRAREVMALTYDSAFNAEVALELRATTAYGSTDTVCYVQVDDRELCAEMAAHTLSLGLSSPVRVEFFSRHDRAARRLLDRHPLPAGDRDHPAVLVVGSGPLAQAFVTEVARRHEAIGKGSPALAVRLVDTDPAVSRVAAQLPLPAATVALHAEPAEITSLTEPSDLDVGHGAQARSPTHVFVCLDDDTAAVAVGAKLSRLLATRNPHVVTAVATSTVFGRVLSDGTTSSPAGPTPLVLHNVVETVYTPEAVRRGDVEDIAQAAHDDYVTACQARGETAETNPSMVPWDQLPDRLKDDNRAQTADIGRKLAAIRAAVVPASGHDEPFEFADYEVERLAQMEHERWARKRRNEGWTYAADRDDDAKRHPDLVRWHELPETSKDKDRSAVRAIPEHLHAAGFAVSRGR